MSADGTPTPRGRACLHPSRSAPRAGPLGVAAKLTPDRASYSSMLWTCANATARNVQLALEAELLDGVRVGQGAQHPGPSVG